MADSAATLHQASDARSSVSVASSTEKEDAVYRGRIEAVKLTGDINIPRGEYTFIAPDIGPDGLIRVASEEMFKGARIVKSVGHIAARGFRDGKQRAELGNPRYGHLTDIAADMASCSLTSNDLADEDSRMQPILMSRRQQSILA